MIDEFVYWITERDYIRELRAGGVDKPWSKDPVFQKTYFCNVHREDDKVTRWIRERYNPWCDDAMFIPNIMLARLVNRIESLNKLGYMEREFNEDLFRLAEYQTSPFWGAAYVVTTHGRKMTKIDYACEILDVAFKHPPKLVKYSTLKDAHESIMDYEGFASFMAAQVIADLKNTPGHQLAEAEDWDTWSAPGPGSARGLKWIFGEHYMARRYSILISKLWGEVEDRVPKMCMQDLQNCLCEFDKYMRVKTGTGRSKRGYNGHG